MRLVVQLQPQHEVIQLPLAYNSLVQGFVYHNLEPTLAAHVHDSGTPFGKRQFRFFTFSRLLGKYRIKGKTIEFSGPLKLYIGSVHEEILQSFVEHLLKEPVAHFGKEPCSVSSVEVEALPEMRRPVTIRDLSAITTYSTLNAPDGSKKTYYYSPFEKEWEEKLLANLERKAKALNWGNGQLEELSSAHIRPIKVDKRNLRIMSYRGTVIKGWTGLYELDLPEPFFLLAYDAGLGSKNPQGFGMVEVMPHKKGGGR